jgi:pimeloyl-ACP methyl ester carboxylesterase
VSATERTTVAVEAREIMLHGSRMSYRIAGAGPVILLIHGIGGSAGVWADAQKFLADRFTSIAPDLPGHGASGKGTGDYSLGALASMLRDLLVALGHDHATLVGHSLGGGVAMQFSYQFPERTDRLVLVSSGGLGREVNLVLRAASLPGADLSLRATAAPLRIVGSAVGRVLTRLGWRPGAEVSELARGFAALSHPTARAAFLETLRSAGVGARGQRIAATSRLYLATGMPTLLVWGERDPIIPLRHAQDAHEQMPGSRLVVFRGVGHMPHLDRPEEFANLLLDFMAQTEPAEFSPERIAGLLRGSDPTDIR